MLVRLISGPIFGGDPATFARTAAGRTPPGLAPTGRRAGLAARVAAVAAAPTLALLPPTALGVTYVLGGDGALVPTTEAGAPSDGVRVLVRTVAGAPLGWMDVRELRPTGMPELRVLVSDGARTVYDGVWRLVTVVGGAALEATVTHPAAPDRPLVLAQSRTILGAGPAARLVVTTRAVSPALTFETQAPMPMQAGDAAVATARVDGRVVVWRTPAVREFDDLYFPGDTATITLDGAPYGRMVDEGFGADALVFRTTAGAPMPADQARPLRALVDVGERTAMLTVLPLLPIVWFPPTMP